MRIANYRDDVLWAIAYKLGLDPAKEFLTDEGASLDSYINAWVRRTWDSTDFPEWATIKEFAPDANHQVPWSTFPVGTLVPVVLSRPLKVYLVDPRTSPYPIDTRFREWDEGLHVGFDHGATVWIKYLGLAPKFTSTPWDIITTYSKDALVYSPAAGQCFKSLLNGNIGHDPNPAALGTPINLYSQVLVPFFPGSAATAAVSEKWSVKVDLLNLYAQGNRTYSLAFLDAAGASDHAFSYTTPADGGTIANVLDGLIAAAAASADPWITALTLSKDLANAALIIELATAAFNVLAATVATPDEPVTGDDALPVTGDDAQVVMVAPLVITHPLSKTNIQHYAAARPAIPPTAQVTQVTLTPGGEVLPGCMWTITVTDTDGSVHVASYQSLPTDGVTEIINGILAAFTPHPPDECFEELVVTADYDLKLITIVSPEYIIVEASVTPPLGLNKWELVAFPYALIEPVVRGAYSDALREAGQTDKAMAEEQITVQEQGDRVTKALAPGYNPLTDQLAPAPRYRSKLPAQGAGK
jgi:hypothetical protein